MGRDIYKQNSLKEEKKEYFTGKFNIKTFLHLNTYNIPHIIFIRKEEKNIFQHIRD